MPTRDLFVPFPLFALAFYLSLSASRSSLPRKCFLLSQNLCLRRYGTPQLAYAPSLIFFYIFAIVNLWPPIPTQPASRLDGTVFSRLIWTFGGLPLFW